MKKFLLILLLPLLAFSQDIMEPVTFRLDLNDVIEEELKGLEKEIGRASCRERV